MSNEDFRALIGKIVPDLNQQALDEKSLQAERVLRETSLLASSGVKSLFSQLVEFIGGASTEGQNLLLAMKANLGSFSSKMVIKESGNGQAIGLCDTIQYRIPSHPYEVIEHAPFLMIVADSPSKDDPNQDRLVIVRHNQIGGHIVGLDEGFRFRKIKPENLQDALVEMIVEPPTNDQRGSIHDRDPRLKLVNYFWKHLEDR